MIKFENSIALCEHIKKIQGPKVVLSFSNGKDSIAAWLQLKRNGFEVTPVYFESVPGLEFIEKSIKYYENFFETDVLRYPSEWLLSQFEGGFKMDPRTKEATRDCEMFFDMTRDECISDASKVNGVPLTSLYATGSKNDSVGMAMKFGSYGPIWEKENRFQPIYDWSTKRIIVELENEKLKLPVDYSIFHRSFNGCDFECLSVIRTKFPDDWERIKLWIPLAEVEIKRREFQPKTETSIESEESEERS